MKELVEYRRWCVKFIAYTWIGKSEDEAEKEIIYDEIEYFPTEEEADAKATELENTAKDEEWANYELTVEEDSDIVTKQEYENYFEKYELIE